MNTNQMAQELAELHVKTAGNPTQSERKSADKLGNELMNMYSSDISSLVDNVIETVGECGMNLRRLSESFEADDEHDYAFLKAQIVEGVRLSRNRLQKANKATKKWADRVEGYLKDAEAVVRSF